MWFGEESILTQRKNEDVEVTEEAGLPEAVMLLLDTGRAL
jgi:hypothetical protein